MTAFNEFAERLQKLEKLLSNDPYTPIPDKVWQTHTKTLDKILKVLKGYYLPERPSPAEIKTVKEHPITAQIRAFIDRDKERKAFFTLGYFQNKCASLPDKDLLQDLPKGRTRASLLTAFLVYHYWKAKPDPLRGLESARAEIEEDFKNSPAARQAEEAKGLFNELQRESDVNRIVAVLQEKFPDRTAVTAFAKAVSLKVPGGRGPVHERLAGKILKAGELLRAKF
jgi:hypothetical protein